ncbi:uncharacterized protein LOC122934704 [Bufo gargarizans]|uniref:uncharacterized protein LOC122934704 n=1 Tax=Bufo gargarizans TaxID=30331 RepID=UPI001CF2888E|nr:uncharacterized protein LOC122934704 [Bufo gargarizans]
MDSSVGKHTPKAVPGRSTTPAVNPPQSNASARKPRLGKALEMPGQYGKFQEPCKASEPPKVLNTQGVHPTTRSTKSTEDSSNAARAATGKKYSRTSKDSGALHPIPDVPKRQATRASGNHLSQGDIDDIERQTRGQRENPEWYYWRQNRITASLAHRISHSRFANQKTNDIPQSYLKTILGSAPGVQTAAMNWGIRNEKKAVNAYERLASIHKGREVQVEPCGLFIHPTKNWLAASPDGVVKDRQTGETLNILEVKCPYKHREHTVREACKDNDFCLTLNGDSYTLKPRHTYYTQVQTQMAVTGIRNVDFVVHTKKETVVVPVKFDLEFWKTTEPKLERFYTEAVLPNVEDTNKREVQNKGVYTPEE